MLNDHKEIDIYDKLKEKLHQVLVLNNLLDETVHIHCKALTSKEAIGITEHDDYPIIKGREVMIEADFMGTKGQAFADSFEQMTYQLKDLLLMELSSNKKRASFISSLNAVYRHLGLCDKTVHCKDVEPKDCADRLLKEVDFSERILMVGFQPRFLDVLSTNRQLRIVDLDEDNIGKGFNGVTVESEVNTTDAIEWCDMIFATGSTIVNGTITRFLEQPKPVIFYGVTLSAAGKILDLNTYCSCGR